MATKPCHLRLSRSHRCSVRLPCAPGCPCRYLHPLQEAPDHSVQELRVVLPTLAILTSAHTAPLAPSRLLRCRIQFAPSTQHRSAQPSTWRASICAHHHTYCPPIRHSQGPHNKYTYSSDVYLARAPTMPIFAPYLAIVYGDLDSSISTTYDATPYPNGGRCSSLRRRCRLVPQHRSS